MTHLRAELAIRKLEVAVSTVDAGGLERLLSDRANADGTAVVDVTGVLPSAVFGPSVDLVHPWLDAGGVLVWAGAPLAKYRSASGIGRAPPHAATANPPGQGASALVGCQHRGCIVIGRRAIRATASSPTSMARALGIEFQMSAFGVTSSSLARLHAVALGWTGAGVSSVTAIPVGQGAVVVFAAPVLRSDASTGDIAILLAALRLRGFDRSCLDDGGPADRPS